MGIGGAGLCHTDDDLRISPVRFFPDITALDNFDDVGFYCLDVGAFFLCLCRRILVCVGQIPDFPGRVGTQGILQIACGAVTIDILIENADPILVYDTGNHALFTGLDFGNDRAVYGRHTADIQGQKDSPA